jgi:hypothetical protein
MPLKGQLQYGDFKFPENYTHSIEISPWYAEDGKSQKGYQATLTVNFFLYDRVVNPDPFEAPVEAQIESSKKDNAVFSARKILLTPRLHLIVNDTGIASTIAPFDIITGSGLVILGLSGTTTNINTANIYGDADHGPLPLGLSIDPVVGTNAAKCVWTCSFKYECVSSFIRPKGALIEINYKTGFEVDMHGRTTIVHEGLYAITSYEMLLPDPEKQVLEEIANLRIKTPPGFVINGKTVTISENREKCYFRCELQEMQSSNVTIFPAVKIDARHQVKSGLFAKAQDGAGFCTWKNKLDATVYLISGYKPIDAYAVFLFLLLQKTSYDAADSRTQKEFPFPTLLFATDEVTQVDPKEKEGVTFLTSLTMTESIYDSVHSFSAEWIITVNIDQLLFKSGLFRQITSQPIRFGSTFVPWVPEEGSPYVKDPSLTEENRSSQQKLELELFEYSILYNDRFTEESTTPHDRGEYSDSFRVFKGKADKLNILLSQINNYYFIN